LLVIVSALAPDSVRDRILTIITTRFWVTGAAFDTVKHAFTSPEQTKTAAGLLGILITIVFAVSPRRCNGPTYEHGVGRLVLPPRPGPRREMARRGCRGPPDGRRGRGHPQRPGRVGALLEFLLIIAAVLGPAVVDGDSTLARWMRSGRPTAIEAHAAPALPGPADDPTRWTVPGLLPEPTVQMLMLQRLVSGNLGEPSTTLN
jgi:hypothetical protein